MLFPLTYTFGDVFTEVYGYPASRRAIWIGFFASALLSAAVAMVADHGWHNQQAFETVFGLVPRFEANAFVLARLKVLTHRRWLWTCAIGSTIVGQRCDSFLVSFLAGSEDRPKLV